MKLTPVPVRRKRKFAGSTAPIALQLPQQQQQQQQAVQHHPKTQRSVQQVRLSRLGKRQASLESLPTEILELILLYSSNVSLPRASPLIGLKLSGRFTLLRLFNWGFHETWQQWFGIPSSGSVPIGPQLESYYLQREDQRDQTTLVDGDYKLQSALLEQHWVSVDFILQAHQTWADKYAKDRWYQHIPIPFSSSPSTADHEDGGYGHFNAAECFEIDCNREAEYILPHEIDYPHHVMQEIHPSTTIPHHLITGPWNTEQRRRLYWLYRAGFKILSSVPPWEDILECLRNAIIDAEEPDPLVRFCLLSHPTVYANIPRPTLIKELQRLRKRLDWGGDSDEARFLLRSVSRGLQYMIDQ